jgi:hypothetical protein
MRIRESSSKSRCETDGAFLHTLTPVMSSNSSSYNKRLDNPKHIEGTNKGREDPLVEDL